MATTSVSILVKQQANRACTSTYTLFRVTSVMLPTQAAASAAFCLANRHMCNAIGHVH